MNVPGIDLRALCRHVADERPATAAEQQKQGFSLLQQPKKPSARQAPVSPDMDNLLHNPTEDNLLALCGMLFGQAEMEAHGGLWRNKARSDPTALHEALLDVRMMMRERRGPRNPAAYVMAMLPKPQ